MSDNPVSPTTETPQPQSGNKVEFTPEQQRVIDYEIATRARRAEESATRKTLEKLGFDNLDSAADALKKAKEREEAEMGEVERLKKQIDDLSNKNKAHVEQISFMLRQRLTDARDSAIKSALTDARATNPDRVFKLLSVEKTADLEAVMNQSGEIDKKAVEALIKAASKDYAEYFRSGAPGSPSNAGGTPPSADAERIKQTLAQRKPVRF